MSDYEDDPAVFSSDTLPSDLRFMATVANGYLGTRVYGDVMHINGIYNGANGDSCRADVPSTVNARLTIPDERTFKETYTLNTRIGVFSYIIETQHFRMIQQIFAHRTQIHLMVLIITLERLTTSKEQCTVQIKSSFAPHSQNIDFVSGPDFMGAKYIYGQTLTPEVKGAARQNVHMISVPLPESLTMLPEEQRNSWVFLTAVASTAEQVKACFVEGQSLIQFDQLYSSHVAAWAALWKQSCISAKGCRKLNQAMYGCLYYLLSALPPLKSTDFHYIGLSPGGLSNGGKGEIYHGHVFWDQEIWMFPNVLVFYPELARILLKNRIQTLPAAKIIAGQQGYRGAKYPWESAVTGFEVCNEAVYGLKEIHINGDISFAFQQYFYVTQDLEFFQKDGGWYVVSNIAEFWSSRVTWNPLEECYDIKGVVVKQADVVLLGYPLMYPMSTPVRKNDLVMYEGVTAQDGPAMTWSMFAIGWLELKNVSQAQHQFSKCYSHIQEPFKVWSENPDGSGAVNFLTGMGGFMQTVLFGYTGFRIMKNYLYFDPTISDSLGELWITGINYLGNKLHFQFSTKQVTIVLIRPCGFRHSALEVVLSDSGKKFALNEGQAVTFLLEPGLIQRKCPAAASVLSNKL
ncbi:protein-glucosylgalactosylhydroxylysine glucosidase isoform X3 [Chiloscyllium plagiosum]|uniref:protein-glucosylgalactosylhydroxylysine glucosidase isoform X3 n=1 Tax=Chiloscyllium plagiosum TaxID=36176 RepID=UPI001CB888AD|nr:protein-glucosylgalactosylhydroxylysine glucosidase isoform X3 [Chiloscyllium plagiosum]